LLKIHIINWCLCCMSQIVKPHTNFLYVLFPTLTRSLVTSVLLLVCLANIVPWLLKCFICGQIGLQYLHYL
jgi:hypothetical protein